jgi:hypothetical protein
MASGNNGRPACVSQHPATRHRSFARRAGIDSRDMDGEERICHLGNASMRLLSITACLTGALALMLSAASGARAADRAVADAFSVHLFLQKSGVFSTDVTSLPDFNAWNLEVSGRGIPEGERFDSIAIKVRLRADKEVFAKGEQGRLVVTTIKDNKVIRNERIADIYIGPGGVGYRVYFVADVGCRGLQIALTSGGKTLRKTLNFNCGE